MKVKFFRQSFFGYVERDFDESELIPIKDEIEEIFSRIKNYSLGHIEKEFRMVKSVEYVNRLLIPIYSKLELECNYLKRINFLDKDLPLRLTNLWVNFQKKNEFLPVHNHGGIYSFVIWIKIPYDIEEELNHQNSRYANSIGNCHNLSGNFQFLYLDELGNINTHNIPADRKYENKMILFPSSINHLVYPFYTSDDYRISISGNVKLCVS